MSSVLWKYFVLFINNYKFKGNNIERIYAYNIIFDLTENIKENRYCEMINKKCVKNGIFVSNLNNFYIAKSLKVWYNYYV